MSGISRRFLVCAATAVIATAIGYGSHAWAAEQSYRIRIELGGKILTATLEDNPTTRDLISMLPLTLPAKDFMHFEKIAYLPRSLTTEEAPASYTPVAGDVGYFAPWGNLALFHADWRPSPGLVYLGRFDGPLDGLRIKGEMSVRVEQIP